MNKWYLDEITHFQSSGYVVEIKLIDFGVPQSMSVIVK